MRLAGQVRLGVRARPVRPELRRPQAHRARSLPAREHGLPRPPEQAVRALHGRRHRQRRRLQVRLRPPVPAGPARGEPAHPHQRQALHRPLGAAEPAHVRRARRQPARAPTSGTGYLARGARSPSSSTRNARIAAAVGAPRVPATHYATNRPEDVEVDEDGTVYIALTNNIAPANDTHGSIRRLREAGNDPTRAGHVHLGGLRRRRADRPQPRRASRASRPRTTSSSTRPGTSGSSRTSRRASSTTRPTRTPTTATTRCSWSRAPARTRASGSASRTCRSRPRAPARTSRRTSRRCSSTSSIRARRRRRRPRAACTATSSTYTSYWPKGNKTTGQNPSTPIPSLVAISKIPPGETPPPGGNVIPPPRPAPTARRRAWRSCPPPARALAR